MNGIMIVRAEHPDRRADDGEAVSDIRVVLLCGGCVTCMIDNQWNVFRCVWT